KPRADETGEENPARTNGRKNAPKRTGIKSCSQKCRLKPETGLQTAFKIPPHSSENRRFHS
ncbi:hypothetical protein MM708_29960, partial [Klebsiella pneumoniae]|nr:hypothetical protein [Klebsiella pneumoniae]